VSSGQMKEARSAFSASLEETERRRAKIDDKENRAQFLDKARPVIDRVVAFDLEQADTVGALEFLEHMRARVLLDRVGRRLAASARRPSRQPIADLQRTIPAGTSVISYAVLDSEVVSWVLHDDRVTMHRTHLTTSLEGLITRFTALIEARSSATEVRALSAQLYSVLIAPLRDDIAGDTRLIVIPDKWLHFLPFSALFDARAGRFLVESFEISVAPSIALYQQSAARYAQLGTATPSVLAVGNPSFDAATFRLPRLPGAELEAARVAQGYDHAQLMVGAAATKRAFLREAATSAVVHFAGHGVVNSNAPLLSYLLLAPEPNVGSSGALYVRDLFDIALPRTRLAILSGCHTAAGQLSETEGASSLARALFAAGVPVVIASLWAVDDRDAAEFFVSFHRELARGTDPAAALRATQLQWLTKEEGGRQTLATWAAFQLFGATSGSGRGR
jgi:CHAT domain-containing protein